MVRSVHEGVFDSERGIVELEAKGVILDGLDSLPVPMFKGGKINLFVSDDSNQLIGTFSAMKNTANQDIGHIKINKFPGLFVDLYHKKPTDKKIYSRYQLFEFYKQISNDQKWPKLVNENNINIE